MKTNREAPMIGRAFGGTERLTSAIDAYRKGMTRSSFSTSIAQQLLTERNASIATAFSKLNMMYSNSSGNLKVARVLLVAISLFPVGKQICDAAVDPRYTCF